MAEVIRALNESPESWDAIAAVGIFACIVIIFWIIFKYS